MKALLDTHALIWYLLDDARLGKVPLTFIKSGENELLVSVASCWELAIKCSLGKITLGQPFEKFIWPQLRANGFELFQISEEHLNRVGTLPPHHRDPFDRLLIGQALVEQIPIVSADSALDAYGVERIW